MEDNSSCPSVNRRQHRRGVFKLLWILCWCPYWGAIIGTPTPVLDETGLPLPPWMEQVTPHPLDEMDTHYLLDGTYPYHLGWNKGTLYHSGWNWGTSFSLIKLRAIWAPMKQAEPSPPPTGWNMGITLHVVLCAWKQNHILRPTLQGFPFIVSTKCGLLPSHIRCFVYAVCFQILILQQCNISFGWHNWTPNLHCCQKRYS